MRILIATVQTPFVRGGAEILAEELLAALSAQGHEAELCSVPFKWYPPQTIADHMVACRMLDLSEFNATAVDRVIGLKFPAYFVRHPKKSLWLVHQHRETYDLWDRKIGAMYHSQDGAAIRQLVTEADTAILREEYRRRYTISRNVSARLEKYCGIDSTALYHPPRKPDLFHTKSPERFLFFPSRITPIKRQYLAIEALAAAKESDIRLVFAGTADSTTYQQELEDFAAVRGLSDRVDFMGYVSDEEKADLYARCLGVVYTPLDEDYGYITLEAMLSGKPVLTCEDSGGVLEFVEHGTTGRICGAEADDLGRAMDELWTSPEQAEQWGANARDLYHSMGISWDSVVEALIQ